MKVVKVFVRCELNRLEDTLGILRNMGLNVEYHSESEPGVVIGAIDETKIPELRNIVGVLGVWEDQRFELCRRKEGE